MKKRILILLVAFVLVFSLAACNKTETPTGGGDAAAPAGNTGGDTAAAPGGDSSTSSSTSTGVSGDVNAPAGYSGSGETAGGDAAAELPPAEITVAFSAIPNGLDPCSEDLLVNMCLSNDIYDRLIFYNSTMDMIPGVAKTWKQLDEVTWEFEIDMSLIFHNGDPITMDDVVYSVMRLKEIPLSADAGSVLESCTYEGNILTIKFTAPSNVNLAKLISRFILVSQSYIEAGGDEAIYLKPIGTGPYKVTEFVPGTTVVLEAFEDYPYGKRQIEKITYVSIPEASARYIAVETGYAQYAALVSALEVELAEKDSGLTVIGSPSARNIHLSFNNESGVTTNLNVRRALTYALDRDSICSIYGGRPPVKSLLFGGYPSMYIDPPGLPEFDLDKAKELLEAEGYGPGNPLKIEIVYSPIVDPAVEMYQSALLSIGVDCTLSLVEFSVYQQREADGDFSVIFTSGSNRGGHPLTDLDRFDKNMIGSRNICRYSNDKVQEIIDKMRVTLDDQEMKDLALEINTILGEEVPNVGIFLMPLYSVATKGLEGVILRPDQQQAFRFATFNP